MHAVCAQTWLLEADEGDRERIQRHGCTESAFDALPHAVVVMDLDGRIQYANRRFLHEMAQTKEQVLGKTPADLGVLGDEQFVQLKSEVIPELISEESVVNIETTVQWPDGRSVPVLLSVGSLRNVTGEPQTVVGSIRDISLIKRAPRTTDEKEKMLTALFNAIPESLFLVDSTGRVLACNEPAVQMVGKSPQEIVGRALIDCLASIAPCDSTEQRTAKVADALQSGKPTCFTDEHRGLALEHTFYPVLDDEGRATDILVRTRDVTKQKQTQNELREYCERLRAVEQLASLGTLSATLVHELTQPLSAVRLVSQTALAEAKKLNCPDVIKTDLELLLRASATMAAIISRFRDYARQSTRTRETHVHVDAVAERTIRLLGHSAQEAKVTIQTDGLEALPSVRMGENEMEQLFFTIAQNAIQAADGVEDHHLVIVGAVRGDAIELQFQDNCGGIEPACLPKIFEPFFTTKPPGRGTGLGLCIARRIVQQRGGHISVRNRHGEGVTFAVTLPRE